MPLQYPQINGVRFDFSSVELKGDGASLLTGVKSLNYGHKLSPGELRGNRAQVVGRTRGKYEANADMEVYKSEWDTFRRSLGPGYMERSFQISAAHWEPSLPADSIITDVLQGCRIVEEEDQKQEGEEALVVKVTLHVMYVMFNGQLPMNPAKMLL